MSTSDALLAVTVIVCCLAVILLVVVAVKWFPGKSTRRVGAALQRSFDAGIQKANERQLLEDTTLDGDEPVWFSRHVHAGQSRHWVLVTHDSKYELRRVRSFANMNVDVESGNADNGGWIAAGAGDALYEYRIQPCSIDTQRIATATVNFSGFLHTDNLHTTTVIGWTSLAKSEVDKAWIAILEGLGDYDMLWNTCQHALRDFASTITQKKAADWNQFITQSSLIHQRRLHATPVGADLGVVTASLERLKTMLPQVTGNEKDVLERNMKNLRVIIQKQQQTLAMSRPIDLADASNLSLFRGAQRGKRRRMV